jgi:hypothetical protein
MTDHNVDPGLEFGIKCARGQGLLELLEAGGADAPLLCRLQLPYQSGDLKGLWTMLQPRR